MNQILATVEDTKLNLRMLSASMYDTPLRIALNRPMYQHCQAFDRICFMLATSSKLRAVINISLGDIAPHLRVGECRGAQAEGVSHCKIKYPSLRGVFYFNYHRPNVRINPR